MADDTNPRDQIPRRQFLKGAGAAGTAVAAVMTPVAVTQAEAQSARPAAGPAQHAPETWLTARRSSETIWPSLRTLGCRRIRTGS